MILTEKSSPEVVQFYLKKIKLTQRDVAKKLDVTPGAVSRAITEVENPSLIELRSRIISLIKHKQLQAA